MLADRLDQMRLRKEADFIDGLIMKFAQMEAEMDENEAGCDFEVDECHNCYAVCGETDWLCPACKQLAQKMGITEKQLAYDDPAAADEFELDEMLDSNKPIVEDLSEDPDVDRTPGRN